MFSPRAGVGGSLGRGRRVDSVIGGTIESQPKTYLRNPSNENPIYHMSSSNLFVSGSLGNGKKSPFLEREVALPRLDCVA